MADIATCRLGDSGLMVSVVGVGCNAFVSRIDADQQVAANVEAGLWARAPRTSWRWTSCAGLRRSPTRPSGSASS